jgi:hypothetical protein
MLAARETEREGPGLLLSPKPVPNTTLPGRERDLDLVFERETSRKRPKTDRGRSAASGAGTGARSVAITSSLTGCTPMGVMGWEGGCVGVAFSVLADAERGVLPGRFLEEEDSTGAKAGAITIGEETEDEP